jgi:hypothetical protein
MKRTVYIRSFLFIFLFLPTAYGWCQSISGVVNSYYQVTAINIGPNSVTLSSVAGLSPGTKVLLIQMKGATINNANGSTYGNITGINNAGNYEFNIICSITGNDALLKYQLVNSYTVANQVQMVSVPVYSAVTITGPLTSNAWDPVSGTGGIVAIEASTSITIGSSIDVSGLGFQGGALQNYPVPPYDCSWAFPVTDYYTTIPPTGGAYYTAGMKGEGITAYIAGQLYGRGKLASGGGGGNNNNTGGAGGGNYGAGGNGGERTMESFFSCHGTNPGVGGAALSGFGYSGVQNRIFLGGGGGGGHENNGVGMPGGNGGGIVILTAPLITGSGVSILANGVSPTNPACVDPTQAEGDGGGGGGAGGTIILNASTVTGTITAQAMGANGTNASNNVTDCTGPGGGGGGGVIWVSGGAFPGAVAGNVNGGANGVVSSGSGNAACRGNANNATPGANGNQQTGYTPPIGTTSVCTVLPASDLRYFNGKIISDGAELTWALYQTFDIDSYELEYSTDQKEFAAVKDFKNLGEMAFTYNDRRIWDGTIYYRLKMNFRDGSSAYSPIVPLTVASPSTLQLLAIQPNPVDDIINLAVYAKKNSDAFITVYNAYGQRIFSSKQLISQGYSKISIAAGTMASGAYILVMEGQDIRAVKAFLKK